MGQLLAYQHGHTATHEAMRRALAGGASRSTMQLRRRTVELLATTARQARRAGSGDEAPHARRAAGAADEAADGTCGVEVAGGGTHPKPRGGRRPLLINTVAAASIAITTVAQAMPPWLQADDPSDPWALPDAPAPPTLPDLTHRALAASLETTIARIGTRLPGTDAPTAMTDTGLINRFEFEQSLAMRRWYLGISEELAASTAAPGSGLLWVAGQPEIWGRAVWASRAGLAYGGGLGLVVPLFAHGDDGTRVTESVRVVRPWDSVQFLNYAWTLRPFVDVRQIDGPIILQLRQGIDWAIDTGQGSAPRDLFTAAIRGSTELTSRTTFFIGYRPNALIGVGLEFWEVYAIKTRSATYAVSPSIRFMTRILQPAISFLAPIDRPLLGSVDSYWAFRIHLGLVVDPVRLVQRDNAPAEPLAPPAPLPPL